MDLLSRLLTDSVARLFVPSQSCVHSSHLVVSYMVDVKEVLKIFDLKVSFLTSLTRKPPTALSSWATLQGKVLVDNVPLPGGGSIAGLTGRKTDSEFFFKFTSFLYPGTIYRYDLVKRTQTVFRYGCFLIGVTFSGNLNLLCVHRATTIQDFNAEQYQTEQVIPYRFVSDQQAHQTEYPCV